ncbi:MAG: patatin-like phospholipase family protein [Bryobacteraceae bacterium]
MPAGGRKVAFNDVFARELDEVAARRETCGMGPPEPGPPSTEQRLMGLALSGGGIRSASFCLGVIQALAKEDLLQRVDYLSTVSGGGYIGACVSSLLGGATKDGGLSAGAAFPLRKETGEKEPPALTHLRNSSNYLSSGGLLGTLRMASLAVRGIVLNLLLLTPFLLLTVVGTYLLYQIPGVQPVRYAATGMLICGVIFGVMLLLFPLASRGFHEWFDWKKRNWLELRLAYALMLFLGAAASVPVLWVVDHVLLYPWSTLSYDALFSLQYWGLWLFSGILGITFLLAGPASIFATPMVKKVFLILAGLMGPLSIFVTYLGLCIALVPAPYLSSSVAEELFLRVDQSETNLKALNERGGSMLAGELRRKGFLEADKVNAWPAKVKVRTLPEVTKEGYSLLIAGTDKGDLLIKNEHDRLHIKPVREINTWRTPLTLLAMAIVMMLVNHVFLDINTISPHGFYRDRLSKAFLMRQRRVGETDCVMENDSLLLSQMNEKGSASPYHLINAALNLEGSSQPDLRGRNATFFFFSKLYTGSELTGYCQTRDMEIADRNLSLASAMAISAGAAAPNMGATTVKPLVFVLTLLNIRLGYWIPNPGLVPFRLRRSTGVRYLLREAVGRVDERASYVNLSDGGHLENLGVYELLRRRCLWIVAVDAEEDEKLEFRSLTTLIRYARIDMGIEIEIDLSGIRKKREHCAVGAINYGTGTERAWLIYCKTTTTGDENLYVEDYGARHSDFPHEPTADQFFGETQFEAYRALGEHTGTQCVTRLWDLINEQAGVAGTA